MQARVTRFGSAVLAMCAALLSACGPKAPEGLRAGETLRVIAVRPDGALAAQGGTIIRLASLEMPAPPMLPGPVLDNAGTLPVKRPEQLHRTILMDAAMGREVRLYYGGAERDLHGAALAHVYATDEAGARTWLQERLVRAGAARVRPAPNDDNSIVADLLKWERLARANKKGLWADPAFAVRTTDPAALSGGMGAFVLVEGVIANTDRNSNRVFLNFGADYKTDFTASIPEEAWPAWPGGAPALLGLKGERVRVRGVIEQRNGPSMELSAPGQLELIAAPVH